MQTFHHSPQRPASPWLTTLAAGEVQRVPATGARRWLLVQRGCVWVTAAAVAPGPAGREADIWLAEGDSLSLPAGSSWLLQAWPQAELMLVQQAPAAPVRAVAARWQALRAAFSAWVGRVWCARRLLHA